jgi:bifunctional oligoribonuclease and PAP phosphatase NrnA
MPTDPYRHVLDVLTSKHNVLLATHAKPDGDAIGSVAAMSMALARAGISSRVLLFSPLPGKYQFLLDEARVSHFHIESGWPPGAELNSFDALVVLDTGTWSQLPGLQDPLKNFRGPKVVIDHHLTQEDWADVKLVETAAAATGEIVAQLLELWPIKIDATIAMALYLAIATDTGWFQYSNTRPRTLRLAATLMEAGVDSDRLYRLAYQNERPQRLALMARALQSLELLADNRLAVMSLGKPDFQQTGAEGADTENLINLPMQVGSVEVSILVVSLPGDGPARVSLRSKGAVDVAAFAQTFKGGGHARAAGLKLDGDAIAVRHQIIAAMLNELAAPR